VTGSPPFGLFLSELTIVRAGIETGHPWATAATLLLLAVIFIGMAALILEMALGEPPPTQQPIRWLVAGPVALAAMVLVLGLYLPAPLRGALASAATALSGSVP
jgi:hydrogenase-4 component F